MNENLQEQLQAAEAEVAEWRQKVDHVNNSIAAAQRVTDASEGKRAEFALGAATGDASATSAMKKIHSDDQVARRQLDDLKLALAPAQRHLAIAEQAANEIKRAVAKEKSVLLTRKRVAVAARFDAAIAEAEAAHAEFEALGGELNASKFDELAARGYSLGTSVSQMEGLVGGERVKSALPSFIRKLFYTVYFGNYVKLAEAEAAYWQLPAAEKKSDAA
jgi:hypothetical protein